MNGHAFSRKIHRLFQRQDIREHPVRGIYRRIAWRVRWRLSNQPWLVRRETGLPLLLLHGGAAALIYFQGASEPELMNFLQSFLKEGMVFVDVGAHLGEYTVLAASIVKDSGCVHAFEARPDTFEILARNVEMNGLGNVVTNPWAVWNQEGTFDFEQTPDPSVSALRPSPAEGSGPIRLVKVNAVALDGYLQKAGAPKPSLMKVDVEGAELQVLRGAVGLLTSPEAPVLVVEYGRNNTLAFGYSADEVCVFLRNLGYQIYQLTETGLTEVLERPVLSATADTCNLVATKNPLAFSARLLQRNAA
jgi:FkbM family methyltransferase